MSDLRNKPLYPMAEAARIVRAGAPTVRTWFPPLQRQSLSFIQLVEAYIIQTLRVKHHVKMREINKARLWLRQKTGYIYPLAARNLGLETDGVDLYCDLSGLLESANRRGQFAIREVLVKYLTRIEYDAAGLALRFFPFTHGYSMESPKLVVVDPRFNFGRPCITSHSISTLMISRRHAAGESREALADDYRCAIAEIDEAINHETREGRAA